MVLAVEADDLWIGYLDDNDRNIWIIHDASFKVSMGEIYCIVGESGCGKSTLGKAIVGILPPHAETRGVLKIVGETVIRDRDHYYRKVRGRIVSLIPQNPGQALHPYLRIRDQFKYVLRSRYRGIGEDEIRERSYEALRIVGLDPGEVYDSYPHELSGGMQQRTAIALALSTGSRILVADEPTSSLDAHLRMQILRLLERLNRELGLTIIMITHDLLQARKICGRIMVLYAGHIVEEGSVEDVYGNPLHPYTKLLLDTIPILGSRKKLKTIPGEPPEPGKYMVGCPFHPRCPYRMEKCLIETPPTINAGEHRVSCWLYSRNGPAGT